MGMTRRIKLFDGFHGILSSVSQALGNKRWDLCVLFCVLCDDVEANRRGRSLCVCVEYAGVGDSAPIENKKTVP